MFSTTKELMIFKLVLCMGCQNTSFVLEIEHSSIIFFSTKTFRAKQLVLVLIHTQVYCKKYMYSIFT